MSVCVFVCHLQPRPCARLTSSAVGLDAASGCHGDATARMTAQTAAMKRVVRKLVRPRLLSCFQKLNITRASIVAMTTAQNCLAPPTNSLFLFFFLQTQLLSNNRLISLVVASLMERQTCGQTTEAGRHIEIAFNYEQAAKREKWKVCTLFLDAIKLQPEP